jgi:hypothetical protein
MDGVDAWLRVFQVFKEPAHSGASLKLAQVVAQFLQKSFEIGDTSFEMNLPSQLETRCSKLHPVAKNRVLTPEVRMSECPPRRVNSLRNGFSGGA